MTLHSTPRSAFCLGLVVLLSLTSSAEDGWKKLFDGKSLDDWSIKSGYASYEIEDGGVILGKTAEGSPNTFLCTPEKYADFELRFEVKVDQGLNSGVQIRSLLKDQDKNKYGGRVYGPQVEIETGPGQSGFIYGEATGRGWLSPEPKSDNGQHDHFRNDDWNEYRVVAKGPNIKVWINGEMISDLTDEEIYKTHPEGIIGLQVHGIKSGSGPYQVRWRNLKIKSL